MGAFRNLILGPPASELPDRPAARRVSAAIGAPRVPSFALTHPAASPNLATVSEWPALMVDREAALGVPAVKTCRDLIVGAGAQMALYRYRGAERLPPGTLLTRPDPDAALSATLAGTLEDLIYDGRAYWGVLARDGQASERLPEGFPVRARWLPSGDVSPELIDGTDASSYSQLKGYKVAGVRELVPPEDVIRFDSPLGSVLYRGANAITQALELEEAATRLSSTELPAGTLTNLGDKVSDEEGLAIVEAFEVARRTHTLAWLQDVEYNREQLSAEDLQLIEARANAATNMARLHNVPVAMIGASPTGGASAMLYSNLSTQLTLLVSNAVAPLLAAIEQTLSGDQVSPLGQRVAFDVPTFLRSDPAELRAHALELLAAGVIDKDEARAMLGITQTAAAGAASLEPASVDG